MDSFNCVAISKNASYTKYDSPPSGSICLSINSMAKPHRITNLYSSNKNTMHTQQVNNGAILCFKSTKHSVGHTQPVIHVYPTDVLVAITGNATPSAWTAPFATNHFRPVNITSKEAFGSRFPFGKTVLKCLALDYPGSGSGAVSIDSNR